MSPTAATRTRDAVHLTYLNNRYYDTTLAGYPSKIDVPRCPTKWYPTGPESAACDGNEAQQDANGSAGDAISLFALTDHMNTAVAGAGVADQIISATGGYGRSHV